MEQPRGSRHGAVLGLLHQLPGPGACPSNAEHGWMGLGAPRGVGVPPQDILGWTDALREGLISPFIPVCACKCSRQRFR